MKPEGNIQNTQPRGKKPVTVKKAHISKIREMYLASERYQQNVSNYGKDVPRDEMEAVKTEIRKMLKSEGRSNRILAILGAFCILLALAGLGLIVYLWP